MKRLLMLLALGMLAVAWAGCEFVDMEQSQTCGEQKPEQEEVEQDAEEIEP
jgi:hypothetical protein